MYTYLWQTLSCYNTYKTTVTQHMDIGDSILFMAFKYLATDWMVVLKWKCEKTKKNALNKAFNNTDMVHKRVYDSTWIQTLLLQLPS